MGAEGVRRQALHGHDLLNYCLIPLAPRGGEGLGLHAAWNLWFGPHKQLAWDPHDTLSGAAARSRG